MKKPGLFFYPRIFFFLCGLSVAVPQGLALAQEGLSNSSDSKENAHVLSIGGAISAPSETATFGENPAGLVYNRGPKALVLFNTDGKEDELLGTSAFFFTGNGLAAASLGFQTFQNTRDEGGTISFFHFGLATLIEGADLAVGINGNYRFAQRGAIPDAQQERTWTANASLLYNPNGDVRAGFQLYDIANRVKAYGAGLSANVNRSSILAFDTSINDKGKGWTIKPGIGVLAGKLQVTYGYGLKIHRGEESGLRTGNTFGVGFEMTPNFTLQAHYNQISLYYLGAVFRF